MSEAKMPKIESDAEKTEPPTEQVDSIMNQIVHDYPHLRMAHDAGIRADERPDEFAQEFLQAFRRRLQG